MARARYEQTFLKPNGDIIANATVTVREPGTATPIAQSIYVLPTGSSTLSNPLTTDSKGEIAFYLADNQRFDLLVSAPGASPFTWPDQSAQSDPDDIVHASGDESVTGIKTFEEIHTTGDVQVGGDLSIAGELSAQIHNTFYVKDYGAVGDLVADDTAAIQAAINAASLVSGDVVLMQKHLLSSGGLTIDAPIKFGGAAPGYTNQSGTIWTGSRLHITHASAHAIHITSNAVGCVLENFQITGPNTATTGSRTGSGIYNETGIALVRHVVISGQSVGYHSDMPFDELQDVYILNCKSDGYKHNAGASHANETRLEHVFVQNVGGHGFNIHPSDTNNQGVWLSRPVAVSCVGDGIHVEGMAVVAIENPEVSIVSGHGIYCKSVDSLHITTPWVEVAQTTGKAAVYVESCNIVTLTGGYSQTSYNGFTAKTCTWVTVGNHIAKYNFNSGFVIDGTDYVDLVGCQSGAEAGGVVDQPIGLTFANMSSKHCSMIGGTFRENATVISGSLPTSTRILGVDGIDNFDNNAATTTFQAIAGTTGTFSGALAAASAAITGAITAASAAISGALTAASAAFTGAVSTTGYFATPLVDVSGLSNGLNSNINIGGAQAVWLTGPTGAFSLGGFTGGVNGRRLTVWGGQFQTMSIVNEDASSTAANRIVTGTAGTVNCATSAVGHATFVYDGLHGTPRWLLESYG